MASNVQRHDTDDGAIFVVGYDEEDAVSGIAQKLSRNTETPTPSGDAGADRGGGPIRRFTDRFSALRLGHLRSVSLSGHEILDAVRTRRDELYRNSFPELKPRFHSQCTDCRAEFDSDIDACSDCGGEDLRRPDPAEKRAAEQLFESVNKEGQSLRELAKECEPDQWVIGVSAIILRHEYQIATESQFVEDGTVVGAEVDELVRADPQTLRPVVDEEGRIGGHWWACPVHRDDPATAPGRCDECNAERQEVYYVDESGDETRYYFDHEVVDWAYPFPKLGGRDGLAPAAVVWLRQVILEMMDHYGAAYYDTNSDRLPNQFMILHTTNPDHWEEQLNRARDDEDPYDAPIFSNEYSPQDSSTPEVQVVDAMPDELLGQNQAIKSDYKEDIRQAFGISNVHDSDLSDAGGLNNEGLQLEVTDRSIASQQHDYIEGWLDTLAKRLGIDDWRIEFIPNTGPDAEDLAQEVRTAALAARAGLEARLENGSVTIADGTVDIDPGDPGPGQLPSLGGPPQAGGGDGDGDDLPDGGEVPGNGTVAAQAATTDRKAAVVEEALDVLERGYRHIVWADGVDQKAAPFFRSDERVPEFVQELVREAIANGAIHTSFESLTPSSRAKLADLFAENLTQPQGWSLRSLADDLQEEFALDDDEAETIARAETKAINDEARKIGYQKQELSDQDAFKFVGPIDDRKHKSCLWLIGGDSLARTSTGFEGTNPDYGGTAVSLDELQDLVQEANDRFVDSHDARGFAPHIGCRDTYTRDYDAV